MQAWPRPRLVVAEEPATAAGLAVQRAVVVEAGPGPAGAPLGLSGPGLRPTRPARCASASPTRSSIIRPISKSLGV